MEQVKMDHDSKSSDSDEECDKKLKLFSAIIIGNLKVVQNLLTAGVKTNIVDKNNKDNTPLHYATEKNKKDLVKELLHPKWKTDINARNKRGDTPLHIAVSKGFEDIVQILLKHNAKVDVRNNSGSTSRDVAGIINNEKITQMLCKVY
ncbi:osteoclast-stimulating factor 1-like [Ctenocephalides felis]|uniref:osteoclast-stimulating factor 1-like n=1 Tax=Ctenocephalides felis TaxID=7515 RepID=UPI000E6E37CD|nr:osteoclast-stimulating factor 1-like [Ctenocephalides felis]